MRRFTQGAGDGRKIVVVEVHGSKMVVSRLQPDGTTRRSERQFQSESDASAAAGQLARELIGRGYEEHGAAKPPTTRQGVASNSSKTAATPPRRPPSSQDVGNAHLLEALSEGAPAEPVLPRRPVSPAESSSAADADAPRAKAKAKGKKKKKKRKADANGDGLDKRVLAGIGLVGALLLGGFGYIVYDQFIKPPSIVGNWQGSMTEHEVSKYLIHTSYGLILDEDHHAEMTIDRTTSRGTYTLKGNRLKLSLKSDEEEKLKAAVAAAEPPPEKGTADAEGKDEEGDEDREKEEADPAPIDFGPMETEYKVVIGRSTLDLIDPSTNKLVVQLLRFSDAPKASKGSAGGASAEAPKDLAAEAAKADPTADAAIAGQEIAPKDTAFRVKYPKGWKTDTGSRPDNSYSWITLEDGSAKIGIYADVQGSLMSGSDASRHDEPEGSEFAPVHVAHDLYKKTVAEEFSEYKESTPVVIKAAGLGEGRISVFNASEGGILGSTVLRGYHVTFLSRDRRVSVICRCPSGEFAKRKATFLAVCRSLAR